MNEADQRLKELWKLGHTGEAHINREFYTLARERIGPLLEEREQNAPRIQWLDEMIESHKRGIADIEAGRSKPLSEVLESLEKNALEQLVQSQAQVAGTNASLADALAQIEVADAVAKENADAYQEAQTKVERLTFERDTYLAFINGNGALDSREYITLTELREQLALAPQEAKDAQT